MPNIEIKTFVDTLKNAEGTKKKEVKEEVRKQLRAELGEVSEKELKAALKENSVLIRSKAIENKAEENLNTPVELSPKLQAKLTAAKLVNEKGELDIKAIQELLLKSAGDDKYFDYSHKNSEASSAAMDLSQNGVVFKPKEARQLARLLLSKESVESAYSPLKTLWKGFVGGGAGAAIGSTIGVTVANTTAATTNIIVDGVLTSTTETVANGAFIGSSALLGGISAGVVIGADVAAQLLRDEKAVTGKTAIESVLNDEVQTAEEFNNKIDIACKKNKAGGAIMKEIAKAYTEENGTFNAEAMLKDLKKAGGRGSAINNREVYSFYVNQITNKKPEPVQPEPIQPKPEVKRLDPIVAEPIKPVIPQLEVEKPKLEIIPQKVAAPPVHVPLETTAVVLVGETVEQLATKYGVKSADILEWNKDNVQEYGLPGGKKIKAFKVGETIKLIDADMSKTAEPPVSSQLAKKQYENFVKKCVEWGIPLTKGQATKETIDLINKRRATSGEKPIATMEDAIKYAQETRN